MIDHRPARLLVTTAALVVFLLGACQGGADRRPLPPSVPVIQVTMHDYRFEHDPVLQRGRTVFRAHNAGLVDHALTLVRLPEDLALSAPELVHEGAPRTFAMTARLFGRSPGAAGTFAVDLQPGRYALFCSLPDSDGKSHIDKGMVSEFEVR